MTTLVITNRLLFGPNPPGETAARLSYASLETPEESLGIGGMYGARPYPHREPEGDHFARPRPETGHRHRPHAPAPHHHPPLDRAAPHHHRPFEHPPGASIRPMTPEEEANILHPKDETGHHHRPFDKGAEGRDWTPHMDPQGFISHQRVKAALIKRGFSPEDASAITGNLIYESGGNQYPGHPVILNPPTGGQSGDAAWGSAQWERPRKAGLTSPSLDAQVEHIWNEMHGLEAASYAAMRRAHTVAEKASIVNRM
jgi:Phage tail lysozyme